MSNVEKVIDKARRNIVELASEYAVDESAVVWLGGNDFIVVKDGKQIKAQGHARANMSRNFGHSDTKILNRALSDIIAVHQNNIDASRRSQLLKTVIGKLSQIIAEYGATEQNGGSRQ